ncbi:MAG TPA: outer membrane lipoprotein carrier protein LolA [Stellaceae bacterium]|nr:outer membrane lipoprotein carrier protein LolA [Stellaceae bacterium]
MITRRRFLVHAGALTLAFSLMPLTRLWAAAPPKSAALNAQQKADVERVQAYLNGIRTLSSRFEQYSGEGGSAQGQLWLARPGRMRFEYDPPVPVLLVANSKNIFYYDKELEQVSELRVEDTPAGFLLRDQITLSGDVTLTRFEHKPGAIRLTMVQTAEPGQGSATLVLDDKPLQLRQWTIVDPQQKEVTVALTDPHYGAPVDEKLFYWTDPRPNGGAGGRNSIR